MKLIIAPTRNHKERKGGMLVNPVLEIHACQENLDQFGPMPPSSSPPRTSPSVHVRRPRFAFYPPLRFFVNVSQEPRQLFSPLLAAVPFESLPIAFSERG